MKITPENQNDIVAIIAAEFKTFGGGKDSSWGNPISSALKDSAPMFAMGVDVAEVVSRVIELNKQIQK